MVENTTMLLGNLVIMIIKLSTNMGKKLGDYNNKIFYQHGKKNFVIPVKPACNSHPWDPKIVAVVHRWPLFRGFPIKVAIEFDLAGLRVTVVTGLTV
jgi:hypothetical protein